MAVPSSGELSLYGLAKEKELNNYDNTIPISTYNSYYATPISLGNLATGAGGFDATNESSISRPNPYAPHGMSEWYGYDHDYVWTPYYGVPINKPASYSGWVSYTNSIKLYSYVKSPTWSPWTVDNSNVYQTGYADFGGGSGFTIGYDQWINAINGYGPSFVTNGYNRVKQTGYIYGYPATTMYTYLEATSAYLLVDVVVSFKNGTLIPATSVLNNQTYIYVEWYNNGESIAECNIDFKVVPNPIFEL